MDLQPDLHSVRAKTAKTAEDFRLLAHAQGVVDAEAMLAWLEEECCMARSHAKAIVQLLLNADKPPPAAGAPD